MLKHAGYSWSVDEAIFMLTKGEAYRRRFILCPVGTLSGK